MRILKLNNTPVGTKLPNITKTEQTPLKDQDTFQKSSPDNIPDRSVKEWIKENSIQTKPPADTKKNSTLATIGITGAGVAGIVAGYILGGAAGAGAAGSIVGYALGHAGDSKDSVNEKWNNHDIENPVKLTGWSYSTSEYGHSEAHYSTHTESVAHTGYNSDGSTYTYYTTEQKTDVYYTYHHDGYYHTYSPKIDWDKVGDFKTPELVHANPIGSLGGAALGMGAGLIGGGIAEGIGSAFFGTAGTLSKLSGLSGASVGIGAAVGGAVGAAAGYVAGKLQEKQNVVITRTYPVPVTEEKYMGEIPKDWTQNDWSGIDFGPESRPDNSPDGKTSVYRTAPVLNSDGKPVMTDKTETLESKRYSKTSGAFIGAGIGAAAGVLASIAIQLI